MNFAKFINASKAILGDGDKSVRLGLEFGLTLDPELSYSSCIYTPNGRATMQKICTEYWDIAVAHNLPMLALTPTWRTDKERVARSAFASKKVISDNLEFLISLRNANPSYAKHICLGGDFAPKGNAYDPSAALSENEAFDFHADHIEKLAQGRVDVVIGMTLPALSEALGIAKRMSKEKINGILSFVVRSDGKLLDGTPLHEAIHRIDNSFERRPFAYMVNCVHPQTLLRTLTAETKHLDLVKGRLIGIYGNASKKRLEELDNIERIEADDMNEFVASALTLHKEYGLKILGGCCGTNEKYIEALAKGLCLTN